MNSLLYHILCEDMDFHDLCADQTQALPGYRIARARFEAADRAMDDFRDEPMRKAFLNYESACNEMASMQETAAALVGFRMCLNLLAEGLR